MTPLFLDDERDPEQVGFINSEWHIARDFHEACAYCVDGAPSKISFDHDLGDPDDNTGYDFAKWLVENDLNNPGFIPEDFTYTVHSANTPGRANIDGLLASYLKFRA